MYISHDFTAKKLALVMSFE